MVWLFGDEGEFRWQFEAARNDFLAQEVSETRLLGHRDERSVEEVDKRESWRRRRHWIGENRGPYWV